MWVRLMEGPTGEYRALFYKGTGAGGHRTPSAWLLPHSNRLAIRVTSDFNHDVGETNDHCGKRIEIFSQLIELHGRCLFVAITMIMFGAGGDMIGVIPTDEWTFLSFVFTNYTIAEGGDGVSGGSSELTPAAGDAKHALATAKARASSDGAKTYSIEVYLNGRLDIAIAFGDKVLHNSGPLQFFRADNYLGEHLSCYIFPPLSLSDAGLIISSRLCIFL